MSPPISVTPPQGMSRRLFPAFLLPQTLDFGFSCWFSLCPFSLCVSGEGCGVILPWTALGSWTQDGWIPIPQLSS